MLRLYYFLRVMVLFYFLSLFVSVLSLLAWFLGLLCKVLLVVPLDFLNVGDVSRLYGFFLRVDRALFAWIIDFFFRNELFGLRLRSLASLLVRLYQRKVRLHLSRHANFVGGISNLVQRGAIYGMSI